MLKKFFSNLLSSFMGAWIALMLFGVVVVIVIFAVLGKIGSMGGDTTKMKRHSVLTLNLEGTIVETAPTVQMDFRSMLLNREENVQALNDLVAGLREGADNKDIDCLYIRCNGASASPATLHALRDAVAEFKKSGKPVYAYGDGLAQGDYYVATLADSLFLNPQGSVDLHGIAGMTPYLKGLFDKIGVRFDVFKVGTFKSAVEPYILTEMSEPARAQLDSLYNNIWNLMRGDMAQARKLKPQTIDSLINRDIVMLRPAEVALKNKLVDKLMTNRQVNDFFKDFTGAEQEKDVNYVDVSWMAGSSSYFSNPSSKNQVAVLYAEGEIADGNPSQIDFQTIVPVITELADNEDVKAMVLRVNSPGGSVFGSSEIADALAYFKSKKKPFVVSMGDYAASGGYWISCEADSIYADPMTITGSIGIFGLIPNVDGLLEKIGVSPQYVSTYPNGFPLSPVKTLTAGQAAAMQQSIERGYDMFIARVAKGRKMKEERVRQIAEGRVWDGALALKIGLVDRLASLDDAIDTAAAMADISGNENVVIYPRPDDDVWAVLNQMELNATQQLVARALGPQADLKTVFMLTDILNRKPVQALAPVIYFNF